MGVPGVEWADEPAEVALPPLKWSLLRGTDSAGSVRWVLRQERDDGDEFFMLIIDRHGITTGELADSITPIAGRPVAHTLVAQAQLVLPNALRTEETD